MNVVEHHAGIRVQVPVDAERLVDHAAGSRCQGVEVQVVDAVGNFPGALAGANAAVLGANAEEVLIRLDAAEHALVPFVDAIFAREEVAYVDVAAVERGGAGVRSY